MSDNLLSELVALLVQRGVLDPELVVPEPPDADPLRGARELRKRIDATTEGERMDDPLVADLKELVGIDEGEPSVVSFVPWPTASRADQDSADPLETALRRLVGGLADAADEGEEGHE